MKALVLAGGTGTRLRPFTHSLPKQLMPVANKPVLLHCLRDIHGLGVTQVGIIVGDRAEDIQAVVGDGADLGLDVTYIPQEAPLGLAHCVLIARKFLGDDDFVMYLGDNILLDGASDAVGEFRIRRPDALVVVSTVDDPREYGIAELDLDARVTSVVEKPRTPCSDLALTGVYFFTAEVHESVSRIKPSSRGELEITDVIQNLIDRDRVVVAHVNSGYWTDTGTIDGLLDCNGVLLDTITSDLPGSVDGDSCINGKVIVESGARIVRSRLDGPVVVGAGTVVRDSFLGPHTALARNCSLTSVSITESIVLEGASISNVRGISGSVIGRAASIRGRRSQPHSRLLVGDHACIELAV